MQKYGKPDYRRHAKDGDESVIDYATIVSEIQPVR
jgi:hypothetical protein